MNDGAECQAITPGSGHVFHFDARVTFSQSATPRLQRFGSATLRHCDDVGKVRMWSSVFRK